VGEILVECSKRIIAIKEHFILKLQNLMVPHEASRSFPSQNIITSLGRIVVWTENSSHTEARSEGENLLPIQAKVSSL
jgi:hypothetical protein